MYVDTQTSFSDSQALTATAISSNVLDTLSVLAGGTSAANGVSPNAGIDIGSGPGDLYLVVQVNAALTGGTSPTLTITLETADDAGLTTNKQVLFSTAALAQAAFGPAGTLLVAIHLPIAMYRRYVGLRYTITGGPLTGGSVDAFLTPTLALNRIYQSAINVQ